MRRLIIAASIIFLLSGCGSMPTGKEEQQPVSSQPAVNQPKSEVEKPTPIKTKAATKEQPESDW